MHRASSFVTEARDCFSLRLLATLLSGALVACAPPPEADEEGTDLGDPTALPGDPNDPGTDVATPDEPGPYIQAPGGAFVDIQCGGKHKRYPIKSFTDRGAKYTKSGDHETFEHLNTSCNRVEIDTNDHYKTGTHVFEGDVKIGRVSGQSVVQIFDATSSGPIMMIKAYSSGGGTLKKLSGGVTLATGVEGKWVRVRIVHNLGANTMTIDIDGDRKWSGSGGRGGGFNLKYGNYGTGAPTDIEWRNASW